MSVFLHEEDLPDGVLEGTSALAVDTETMGLNTLRDRLCLLQISDGGGDEHLIRFGPGSNYAAPNLRRILRDPNRLKLFHFARFDLAAIDLTRAPDARLTITEDQLLALTGPDKTLLIKGEDTDQVTIADVTQVQHNQVINGTLYDVYTLGTSGAQILLEDDVSRNTI